MYDMICLTIKGFLYLKMYQKIPEVLNRKLFYFSESEIRFSNLQIYKFEIPAHNSKQLIQTSSSG